jgi:hypothetical protein
MEDEWPFNINFEELKYDLHIYRIQREIFELIRNTNLDLESWKILYNLIKDQIELRKTNDSSFKD